MIHINKIILDGESGLQTLKKAIITGKSFPMSRNYWNYGHIKTINGNLYYRGTYDFADSIIIGYGIETIDDRYRRYWLLTFGGLSLISNGRVRIGVSTEAYVPSTFYKNLIKRIRRLENHQGVKIILTPERIKEYVRRTN